MFHDGTLKSSSILYCPLSSLHWINIFTGLSRQVVSSHTCLFVGHDKDYKAVSRDQVVSQDRLTYNIIYMEESNAGAMPCRVLLHNNQGDVGSSRLAVPKPTGRI